MSQPSYLKLGELLIREGFLSQDQLEKAMLVQKKEGGRLGETLIKLGMIKESDIVYVLGKQLNIPSATLKSGLLQPAKDQGLQELIPKDFCFKNVVLPLSKNLNSLTCAMFDPLDLTLLDNLRKITGSDINRVIATKSDIMQAAENFYGKTDLLRHAVTESYGTENLSIETEGSGETDTSLNLDRLIAIAEEAPVVKLVELIIRQAIDERASDIHIEPLHNKIRLRYRVDGKLYDIPPPAKHLHLAIVSRIKILAKLDIAEKRLPQDGAFMVRIGDRVIDMRVSLIPTIYGEKLVMRILDRSQTITDISSLGFDSRQAEAMRSVLHAPYGLILITGPTGSGKTTTLYAALNEMRDTTKNIVTIEDPVEYHLEGINQVQVKPDIGLTFASGMRSFLRQDPDIMLVGEVRDLETAEICIRAALTGHLVLTTLHTNNVSSAVIRLTDIGIQPYLLMPSLLLVVAQRLVRRLCPDCKEAYEPSQEQIEKFKIQADLLYRPKGCPKCNNIGFKGRLPVAEAMTVTGKIRESIIRNMSTQELRRLAVESGMETLFQNGIKKVAKGLTTMEEVLSQTMDLE